MMFCKRCQQTLLSFSARPENFRPGQGRWVDEREYQRRLAMCRDCPDLHGASTCMHCGCLVGYLTALRDKHCPHPGKPRW